MKVVPLRARPAATSATRPGRRSWPLRDSELPPFELREIDIESDDELHARYLERIPVVEVDGEVVAELDVTRRAPRCARERQTDTVRSVTRDAGRRSR